jgi:hypothetical protein
MGKVQPRDAAGRHIRAHPVRYYTCRWGLAQEYELQPVRVFIARLSGIETYRKSLMVEGGTLLIAALRSGRSFLC